ncbi:SDR family oxidoreductase [Mycobacterium sp.]|uniref:SDR family NAD(P)-dependent oxidoreductase n=1 Tax=Mycobacterium sp. TaxID=1785 RepID=UPI001228B4C7|nr:SDR family oxidoreductase [Mycobacterium sp.]TAM69714.1 MAG: SDR family oxidoreductase [Mycobacterium sp.]
MSVKDKVVVVTGGSRGLGKAMVRAFAAEGAHVVVASRKLDNCTTLADEISAEFGVDALPVACNVSSWAQCDELVQRVHEAFGRADVLINNAGLSPLYPSLDQVSEALFDKVIGVNLKGPFRLCATFGTRMAAGEGGSIINISSVEAIRPRTHALPYAAAKAGLNNLTEGLAQALGPKVRVNAIQCGPFLTDIAASWDPQRRAEFEADLALRRCGEPEEVIGAAMFFATDKSSYATGAILRLDGGRP